MIWHEEAAGSRHALRVAHVSNRVARLDSQSMYNQIEKDAHPMGIYASLYWLVVPSISVFTVLAT